MFNTHTHTHTHTHTKDGLHSCIDGKDFESTYLYELGSQWSYDIVECVQNLFNVNLKQVSFKQKHMKFKEWVKLHLREIPI